MFRNDLFGLAGGNLRFEEQYHCYSMAVSGRSHLEEGLLMFTEINYY